MTLANKLDRDLDLMSGPDANKAAQPDDGGAAFDGPLLPIPDYLEKYYWWAYVRPWAVRTFERDWLINLILWGCYKLLRNVALSAWGDRISGRTLQVSCCYGSLTPSLARRVEAGGGQLDVIDVAPEQLKNLRRKLWDGAPVHLTLRNSVNLEGFADASFDRVLIFFLPHEQPRDVREKTFAEAMRVLKPEGELQIVEFGRSKWWHPLRYIWYPVLYVLEPFARDMWRRDVTEWLPTEGAGLDVRRKMLFGDFYQQLLIRRSFPTV